MSVGSVDYTKKTPLYSSDIVDNLSSNLTNLPLSANQGSILNNKISIIKNIPSLRGNSIEEINDIYDNMSLDIPDMSVYTKFMHHAVAHDILGGGTFVVNGYKLTSLYEYQIIRSYRESVTEVSRIKLNGTWYPWVYQSSRNTVYITLVNYWVQIGDIKPFYKITGDTAYFYILCKSGSTTQNTIITYNLPRPKYDGYVFQCFTTANNTIAGYVKLTSNGNSSSKLFIEAANGISTNESILITGTYIIDPNFVT